jgi:hypothetical protein
VALAREERERNKRRHEKKRPTKQLLLRTVGTKLTDRKYAL